MAGDESLMMSTILVRDDAAMTIRASTKSQVEEEEAVAPRKRRGAGATHPTHAATPTSASTPAFKERGSSQESPCT